MESKELIQALRADAEWAHANEWETPITLGDHLDAAAYALEALLAEVERQAEKLASVTAERDAAVEDLRKNRARKCDCCAYAGRSERWPCVDCQSSISNYGDGWKWRGPQAEEGEADGK